MKLASHFGCRYNGSTSVRAEARQLRELKVSSIAGMLTNYFTIIPPAMHQIIKNTNIGFDSLDNKKPQIYDLRPHY